MIPSPRISVQPRAINLNRLKRQIILLCPARSAFLSNRDSSPFIAPYIPRRLYQEAALEEHTFKFNEPVLTFNNNQQMAEIEERLQENRNRLKLGRACLDKAINLSNEPVGELTCTSFEKNGEPCSDTVFKIYEFSGELILKIFSFGEKTTQISPDGMLNINGEILSMDDHTGLSITNGGVIGSPFKDTHVTILNHKE